MEISEPDKSRETAVSALTKYESTMSDTISKTLETIKECGINKFVENSSSLYTCFSSMEQLCISLGCKSTTELEKRLEALSMDSDSDLADAIEGYFNVCTEWTKLLTRCDQLLDKDSSYPSVAEEKDLRSYQLERLLDVGTNENVTVGDVLSGSSMTWMIFLRHFT